jgi:hypothetical protein
VVAIFTSTPYRSLASRSSRSTVCAFSWSVISEKWPLRYSSHSSTFASRSSALAPLSGEQAAATCEAAAVAPSIMRSALRRSSVLSSAVEPPPASGSRTAPSGAPVLRGGVAVGGPDAVVGASSTSPLSARLRSTSWRPA